MSLLTMINYVQARCNIPVSTTVFASLDSTTTQLLRLLEEEGNDLAMRGDWNVLTLEATHTTVASMSQGAITTIAPTSYRKILNDTIWDRSGLLPIYPVDSVEWQAIQAVVPAGISPYRYRLRGGLLLATPTPPAGLTWAFEYVSKAWIQKVDLTKVQYFAADTDVGLLPEDLLQMGLRWRYMREKGLEYAELFATYEKQVAYYLGTEKPRGRLNAANCSLRTPGIYVPSGNWIP